jgi:hypothetical protein
MDGAAIARAARERARMGLINIIVFEVSQSVEEMSTLLGGGGEVALLYTPFRRLLSKNKLQGKPYIHARMATTGRLSMAQVFLSHSPCLIASFLSSFRFLCIR